MGFSGIYYLFNTVIYLYRFCGRIRHDKIIFMFVKPIDMARFIKPKAGSE